MRRTRRITLLIGAAVIAVGCHNTSEPTYEHLRIYESPYADVDWANDRRLKAQHHDHIGTRPSRIPAYDRAGYDALSLMDYSGNTELPHALTYRLWPPEQWVPSSVSSTLVNVKFFIPNAEEVGGEQHASSPFLTQYIEWYRQGSGPKQSWQYTSMDEMFALIRSGGGFPCLAHPWRYAYERYEGSFCVEIYSAYSAAQAVEPGATENGNQLLLQRWDIALALNQRIWGIAVNDHYGPYLPVGSVAEEIRDSGKIIVLSRAATLDAYREAFARGAILAVRDIGSIKDRYAAIRSIEVGDTFVHIEAQGTVRWVANGFTLATTATLDYESLPPNVRYVRAEVESGGTVVYTQAFTVRPIGDVDGDYDVDEQDQAICASVSRSEITPPQAAACLAAAQSI